MIDKYRIKQVDDRFYIQKLNKIEAVKLFGIRLSKEYEYWQTERFPYKSLEQANNVIYNYLHNKQEISIHEYKDEKL